VTRAEKKEVCAVGGVTKHSSTERNREEMMEEEMMEEEMMEEEMMEEEMMEEEMMEERRVNSAAYNQGSRFGNASETLQLGSRHLGPTIIRGCTVDRAAGQLYPRLSAKLPEPKTKRTDKAEQEKEMELELETTAAADVDRAMDDGELREHKDNEDEEMREDGQREYSDLEERVSVPTVSAALTKFAAGELRGRKWKGTVDELDARETREGAIVEDDSDDEQRIIGEDDAFWRDR
jgi:hypothetical protein